MMIDFFKNLKVALHYRVVQTSVGARVDQPHALNSLSRGQGKVSLINRPPTMASKISKTGPSTFLIMATTPTSTVTLSTQGGLWQRVGGAAIGWKGVWVDGELHLGFSEQIDSNWPPPRKRFIPNSNSNTKRNASWWMKVH
jgi:hypothetical protein